MMPDPAQHPSTLSVALAYAALGLRVLPIKPGSKRPPMTKWVEAATTDPGIITNWFTHLYADHGVGLAMGLQPDGRMIFALDVDEHDVAHSGSETLADLQAEHGNLPDTWCSITGSGGLHLLYVVADGREVRNGTAGDGLDIRGEGGQIVVGPSMHPATGRAYEWESGFAPWDRAIAAAPDWLLTLITASYVPLTPSAPPSPQPSAPPSPFADPDIDSPADWLRAQWHWPSQLRNAGWQHHHTDAKGDTYWTRPGKALRDGDSGHLWGTDGPFTIHSTLAPPELLALGKVGKGGVVTVSPFDFYAAHWHRGDTVSAGRAIRAHMDPAPAPVARRLSAVPAATATSGRKVSTTPMSSIRLARARWLWEQRIPIGELSLLAGPEGLGKSTLAYWLAAQVTNGVLDGELVSQPRAVLVCATEDSWEHTVAPRMLAHGADPEMVHRIDVADGAIHAELSLPADLDAVRELAAEHDAALMILDPLMSRLDPSLDTHRDGSVRQALEPLTNTVRRAKMACLGLIHYNKSGSTNPNDLIMASRAFNAVSRSTSHVIRDPEDESGNVRLFGTEKNNLGRNDLPVLTFTIESWEYDTYDENDNYDGKGSTGRIVWGPDSQTTISGALRSAGVTAGSTTNAVTWLREYMKRHGPTVAAHDVIAAADSAGIPRRTLTNARKSLGVETEDLPGFGPRRTTWYDPDDRRLSPPDPDDQHDPLGEL